MMMMTKRVVKRVEKFGEKSDDEGAYGQSGGGV